MTGVAVNVVPYPRQTVSLAGVIETLTGTFVVTGTVMVFEIAGLGVAQVKEEVMWQEIWSPFAGL